MEQLSWRIRLALTGGLVGPFAAFVAILFLSGGTAAGSGDAVADVGRAGAGANPVAEEPEGPRATITVRASDYGQILFDGRGRALYAFTRDPRTRSVCADACARVWPPYVVEGRPRAGPGTQPSLLGTTRRRTGGRQVTYGGRPLYYFVGDREPGEVGCQNVVEFGGTWLVIRPNGDLVR
jgi:predicted lipoprotein with Yx(FWY)xxD motif